MQTDDSHFSLIAHKKEKPTQSQQLYSKSQTYSNHRKNVDDKWNARIFDCPQGLAPFGLLLGRCHQHHDLLSLDHVQRPKVGPQIDGTRRQGED